MEFYDYKLPESVEAQPARFSYSPDELYTTWMQVLLRDPTLSNERGKIEKMARKYAKENMVPKW